MGDIILLGRRTAFNVQKVLWLLGELGLPFRHIEVGGRDGGLDAAEFVTLNPHRRIPVLRDGAAVIWESHSILRYLAARYASDALWPSDPAERSEADRWMDWSQTALQPAFMKLFWGYYRTPSAEWDRAGLRSAIEDCDRLFVTLDGELARKPFLGGEHFSLGDIPAGTTLYRYFEMGHDVPRHPHVDAWYSRLRSRKAYQQAVTVPFEELRGRREY